MKSLELNKKFLKALSSRSRISILKTLGGKNHTVTELSKTLNLSKSTVHEHLSILVDGELVIKNEDGRKWVYYGLTDKGKYLVHKDIEKMIVMFPLSVLVFLSGIYSIMFLEFKKIESYRGVLKTTSLDTAVFESASTYRSIDSIYLNSYHDLNLVIGTGLILLSLLIMYHLILNVKVKKI
ncbi:regulatory protein ArsR [Methanococcus vannielii SB]|uniref:Regulatory protein ArsR n=1 Tax=Methanococcus vannielii (strain ATCC 35089 / DSM 1224 / JCM 13029 / OCM 148 / SB) TaxID=406327 RepID=A6USI0_METVS|nr:winged helix-turn-helix domain-containing protein [Methanococcus vannielii]ABR55452.1 regulatory protein ArsR [Methanococcus vannielii SB]